MNEWDVPELDPSLQAEEVTPVLMWGHVARSTQIPGVTWAHYVDDYKFTSLLTHPDKLVNTACYATTEINPSLRNSTPAAVALHAVYQKRQLAAHWQSHGLRIWVDLCVPDRFRELNLLGVPKGWLAYSTRVRVVDGGDELARDYEQAATHAGTTPRLLVVGGGLRTKERVAQLPGAHWYPGNSLGTNRRKVA